MTKTQHGIVACVIGATTWGFNGVVSQFLLSHYPVEPSWLVSIRMCLAGLFLTLMVLPTKRAEIRQMLHDPVSLRHLVLFALFGLILSQFSYLSAIKNSNAGTATVLQTLSVVLMSLYLAVRFHKRPTGREILSVFLAFGGVYLAATNGNPSTMVISPLGLTWGLIGAIACVTLSCPVPGAGSSLGSGRCQRPGHDHRRRFSQSDPAGLDGLARIGPDGLAGCCLYRHHRHGPVFYGFCHGYQ